MQFFTFYQRTFSCGSLIRSARHLLFLRQTGSLWLISGLQMLILFHFEVAFDRPEFHRTQQCLFKFRCYTENLLHHYLPLLQVTLSPTALLPSSRTKYLKKDATPLHHLHTHPVLVRHILISLHSHLLPNLKSSWFCLIVLTSSLIIFPITTSCNYLPF